MKEHLYYFIEYNYDKGDHIQKGYVTKTEDGLSAGVWAVRFEGRDYTTPVNKTAVLDNAFTDLTKAKKKLIEILDNKIEESNKNILELSLKRKSIYQSL